MQSRAFGSFCIGPVGSGKSVSSLLRLLQQGSEQAPSRDGIRRTRFAVVRNTFPELRSTTAITYGTVYPGDQYGDITWTSPASHRFAPRGSEMEVEVLFIALDKPKDVRKLLSLELTGAFFNEMREIPRSVVTRMTERVGRYAINERPGTWSGIWGDTNPPDADHWLYEWHHTRRPEGFDFFTQPPGVLEVREIPGGVEIVDEGFPEYQGRKLSSAPVMIFYRGAVQVVDCPVVPIRAADRTWIVSPWHENSVALSRVDVGSNPLGPRSYYGRALSGKSVEEIQSYLQGRYVFVSDGRRVVPQYNGQVHGVDHIPILPDEPILIGADIGGGTLQPSALLFQKHPKGIMLAHREVVCFDLGIKRFGELVREALVKHFPLHVERGLTGTGWGDPAGGKRDEIFETASFDYLRNECGINLRPAPSQDPKMRVAAIAGPCERMIEGKPGLLVNRSSCPMLHKGLSGAWHYRRVATSGEARYHDAPSKNDVSHICDGAGYGFLGAGEFQKLSGRGKSTEMIEVDSSWSVF